MQGHDRLRAEAQGEIAGTSSAASAAAIRFSEWHTEPPTPPSLAHWVRRVHWERALAAAVIVVLVGLVVTISYVLHFRGLGGVVNPIFWVAAFIWTRARYLRTHEEVSDMMEFPSVVPQCPVQVSYSALGLTYGNDVGVVTFIEGRMHFHGRRSSFDLSRADALPRGGTGNTHFLAPPQRSVYWGYEARIDLIPFERVRGHKEAYRKLFMAAFEEWSGSTGSTFRDSVAPPTIPLPKQVRRTHIAPMVVRGLGYLMWAASAATLYMYWHGVEPLECILILIAFVTIAVLCRLCARDSGARVSKIAKLSSGERPEMFSASMEGRIFRMGEKAEVVMGKALS